MIEPDRLPVSALRAASVEKLPVSLARGELALARNVLHDGANKETDRVTALNNLADHRGNSGDRDGALASILKAMEVSRRLARAQPAAFAPNLATVPNNFSNRLSESGDHDGTLAASHQAVEFDR
jgi:hypothetical protein